MPSPGSRQAINSLGGDATLQSVFASEGRVDQAVDEPIRGFAQEHGSRFRERLQAGRDIDRVSQH